MKTTEPLADSPIAAESAVRRDVRDGARKDAELKERITTFLHQRNEAPLRQLQVEVCDGCVAITGAVRTFYQKQLAGHCCQRVAGVQHVVNKVTVEP